MWRVSVCGKCTANFTRGHNRSALVYRFARTERQDLFEVVNDDLFADLFEHLFDELDMQRMGLIIVLRFLVGKNQIKRYLVGLVDDGSMAVGHFADVELEHARDWFEELLGALDQFIGRFWVSRVSPKNDNV